MLDEWSKEVWTPSQMQPPKKSLQDSDPLVGVKLAQSAAHLAGPEE